MYKRQFQNALDAVGITVNKNMVPFDPEKPGVTSGCLLYTSFQMIRENIYDVNGNVAVVNKLYIPVENAVLKVFSSHFSL